MSEVMTSISDSAPRVNDELVSVDIGFWNSPLRGVSEVAACCEAGAVGTTDLIAMNAV